jgi:hypothetical protein
MSMAFKDSVIRITFLSATLNDVNNLACDIGNAYLNTAASPEFSAEVEGKTLFIAQALYTIRSQI